MAIKTLATIKAFFADNSATTSIEYALIATGISIAVIASISALGDPVDGMFGQVKTAWDDTFGD